MLSVTEILDQWNDLTRPLDDGEYAELESAIHKAGAMEELERLFFAKGWLA